MADCYLLIDYVYLDSEERKRFAQASHEYLIEQLQFTGSESLTAASSKYRLNFNHPSKYLIWAPHLERHNHRNQWVAHAFNGDWVAARDRLAKLITLANAEGLSFPVVDEVKHVNASTTVVEPAAGDLVTLSQRNTQLASLVAKVEVRFVVQEDGDLGALAQVLDNSIVVSNNLSMADVSKTLDQLVAMGANPEVLAPFVLNVVNYHNYGNFVDGSNNPCSAAKLQLNGHDRFQTRDGYYFNYVQPWQHFSNTPADGINVYSFALKAEDHQPTGTCNFSRIDNATLQVECGLNNMAADNRYVADFIGTNSNSIVNIYTVNYNVLRVMSLRKNWYAYSFFNMNNPIFKNVCSEK